MIMIFCRVYNSFFDIYRALCYNWMQPFWGKQRIKRWEGCSLPARDFESIYADYSRMVYWAAYGVVKNESDAMGRFPKRIFARDEAPEETRNDGGCAAQKLALPRHGEPLPGRQAEAEARSACGRAAGDARFRRRGAAEAAALDAETRETLPGRSPRCQTSTARQLRCISSPNCGMRRSQSSWV